MSFPMTNGMTGNKEAATLTSMVSGCSQGSAMCPWTPPEYKSEPIAPKLMPMNIDVSSRRNVLPCKGINKLVLRQEPIPANHGMMPPRGQGRHQGPALSQERPTNLPIMPFSNPFNSAMNNPLKTPA